MVRKAKRIVRIIPLCFGGNGVCYTAGGQTDLSLEGSKERQQRSNSSSNFGQDKPFMSIASRRLLVDESMLDSYHYWLNIIYSPRIALRQAAVTTKTPKIKKRRYCIVAGIEAFKKFLPSTVQILRRRSATNRSQIDETVQGVEFGGPKRRCIVHYYHYR